MVLTAQFDYSGFYYETHIVGNLVLNVISHNLAYSPFQGVYYFSFDTGIIIENNNYIGYFKQTNNGGWEDFINSPFNITIKNNNILCWNELEKDIVYITPQASVKKLPFGSQFIPPISISDGIPFHIEFNNEYGVGGEIVLTEYFTIDGTKTGNYINGSMVAQIVALNPDYNSYSRTYYWVFEAGIDSNIICENNMNPKNQLISSSGGNYNFDVLTKNECFWEISTDVSWITNFSNTSGYGNYLGSYTVLPNLENTKRTGNIFLKNNDGEIQATLKVEQLEKDCPRSINYYPISGAPIAISISGNYAYLASYEGGLRIVDITNPTSPNEIGFFNQFYYSVDVEISGNYAYVADLDNGLLILDISNPFLPTLVSRFDPHSATFNLAISGNYAYLLLASGKLKIIDISNPQAPQEIEQFICNGYIQDIKVYGNYAYLACKEYGLKILDISNPSNPYQVSQ